MFISINDPKKIKIAQSLFVDRLNETIPIRNGRYTIGFQGGKIEVDALHADQKIWFIPQTIENNNGQKKYWNAFGLAEKLKTKGSNNIAVEINILLSGPSKKVAGLFAEDSKTGNIVLLHRGKIGGGKKGIGKNAFLEWYEQKTVKVHNKKIEDDIDDVLLVADLGSPNIAKQVGMFVTAVAFFKSKIQEDEISELTDLELAEKIKDSNGKLKRTAAEVFVFPRNPYIVEYVKRRARGICDFCEKKAPFSNIDGKPYLECHHVKWLADGGMDRVENAVALCPNCHRQMHILNCPSDVARLIEKGRMYLNQEEN